MNNAIKKIIIVLLRFVSTLVLKRHKPIVVAITGSVGKTTTKDVVGHGLGSVISVAKADKSHNSDFGVPLSIIRADNPWGSVLGWLEVILKGIRTIFASDYPKVLVLEVGTRFPGDIERIAKWIKPDIAMITHIPEVPVHIEFFGTRQAIVDEKSMLAKHTKVGGTIVLNRDSEYVYDIAKETTHKVMSIGFSPESDVRATSVERIITLDGQYGMRFVVTIGERSYSVFAPGFVAKHQIYGVLFTMAAAEIIGVDVAEVAASMMGLNPTPGRLNPIIGENNTLILDDSYNASPAAMEAAIETLVSIDTPGRHIAILGDMLDLGRMTKEVHENLGAFIKEQKLDMVFLVGPRMKYAYEFLMDKKYAKTKIAYTDDPMAILPELKKMVKMGDTVLVKGSQGMRMEKIVYELMLEKDKADKLLVRQHEEWKKR